MSDQPAPRHEAPSSGAESAEARVDVHDPRIVEAIDRYWRRNVLIMTVLLVIWAIAGLGCGVLFADTLNEFRLGGFRLGFWFAQQGSIIVFVVLILVYALLLNRLDASHHRELDAIRGSSVHGSSARGRPARPGSSA